MQQSRSRPAELASAAIQDISGNAGRFDAEVLSGAVPEFSAAEAEDMLRSYWDVACGSIDRLASERDQNFRVVGATGRFVLKIANRAEPLSVTRLQSAALLHIEATDPSIPVPRVIPTRVGTFEAQAGGSTLRLLTWMEGLPWHTTRRTPAQRRSVATGHARLVLALATFASRDRPQELQWDVRHAARLRSRLDIVPADLSPLVIAALDRFEQHAAPRLAHLPTQIVHNDIQPSNVVVDALNTDRMSGILDFGDMVETPVACDLGVASAYNVLPGRHPLETVGEYVAAFHAIRPLGENELAALPALIMARQATTIVITNWRAVTHPGNATYILRNLPASHAGLAQLLPLAYDEMVDYFRSVCP